jgi:hypothetical protein
MSLKSLSFRHSERILRASRNSPAFSQPEFGHGVAVLQAAFISLGWQMPVSTRKKGKPDGIFGSETKSVVMAFQAKNTLKVDGIAGAKTIARLDELLAKIEPRPQPPKPPSPIPAPPTPPPTDTPATPPAPPSAAPFVPPSDPEFEVGNGDPHLNHDVGAGPWGSVPSRLTTRVLWEGMTDLHFIGAASVFIGDDAVAHLMQYNSNTGSDYQIRLSNMYNEVPSAKKLYDTLAQKLKIYVEKFPVGNYAITSKRTWGGYDYESESKNWFFAVGGYSAWIKGNVTITMNGPNKSYLFNGEYKFYDRYNWDGGKHVTILHITITDETMGEFHREGLSKEYDEFGSCLVKFQWLDGTTIPASQLAPAVPESGR